MVKYSFKLGRNKVNSAKEFHLRGNRDKNK